jgi:hypothetical protein
MSDTVLFKKGNKILGVAERLDSVDLDMTGPVDKAIANLQELKDHWQSRGYRDLYIGEEAYNDAPSTFYVRGIRDENREEKRERLQKQQKAKQARLEAKRLREEKEIEEYKRLKEKYGNV